MKISIIALTVIASFAGTSALACSTAMSTAANQSTQQGSSDRQSNRRVEVVVQRN